MAEEAKKKKFTVTAEGGVTIDKFYKKGQNVEVSDAKVAKSLTDNKLVK